MRTALYDSLTQAMQEALARMNAALTNPARYRLAQADYTEARDTRDALAEREDPADFARSQENDRNHVGAAYYHY